MKTKRLTDMEAYIRRHGSATMEELRTGFNVSMNTVRRDVAELLKTGSVQKVYGGVRSTVQDPVQAAYPKPGGAKRAICFEAAKLVKDGDIVFIDSGTTTVQIIEAIKDMHVTVITNNIQVMMKALEYENIRVIMLPGEVHRKTLSITGEDSAEYLSHMNTNIAFMAATGASLTGVANSSPLEYSIKKAAVAHAERVVLLVAGSKFGTTSLLIYAGLEKFQTVITDSRIPPVYRQRLKDLHIDLRIVEDTGTES
ncbi:MAG: DeoR/GlpR transcriptional regulator [Clostridia bacterium]|nr:DeoR/GlpR transcriptional regulator [Clostridia bacterium]